jgi:uncharacterized membrane protein YuzA (DUF378 family)
VLVLLIVGGLNWGLVGAFNFNLVTTLFGTVSVVTTVIYVAVGLAAVYLALISRKLTKK